MATVSAKSVPKFRVKPKAILQKIHLWSALIIGLFLVIVTTSGVAALYELDINKLVYRHLYHTTPSATPVSLDEAIITVQNAFPDYKVNDAVAKPNEAYLFYLESPDDIHKNVYVDPGTGNINGSYQPEHTVMGWLAHLHYTLLADKIEFPYTEATSQWVKDWVGLTLSDLLLKIISFAFLLMVFTGAYIWWPGVKKLAYTFKLRLGKSDYIKHYDWHKFLGFASLPFLFMWAVTALNFHTPFQGAIKHIWHIVTLSKPAPDVEDFKSSVTPGQDIISSADAQKIAATILPDATFVSYSPPIEPDGTISLWLAQGIDPYAYGEWPGNVNVLLEAYSGEVLYNSAAQSNNWAADFYNNWFFPLHAGVVVPWWGRIFWAMFGLMPLFLAMTGVSMWWIKRKSRLKVEG
ncbi:MAG: PepSY-associated TM helix domain-containing protein [Trueperaceae bacterium]